MKTLANILTSIALVLTVVFSSQAQTGISYKKVSSKAYKNDGFTIRDSLKVNTYQFKVVKNKVKSASLSMADGSVRKKTTPNTRSRQMIQLKKRKSRNPVTGKEIEIAAKNNVKFKNSQDLGKGIQ